MGTGENQGQNKNKNITNKNRVGSKKIKVDELRNKRKKRKIEYIVVYNEENNKHSD